jgi:hypothetical protein
MRPHLSPSYEDEIVRIECQYRHGDWQSSLALDGEAECIDERFAQHHPDGAYRVTIRRHGRERVELFRVINGQLFRA